MSNWIVETSHMVNVPQIIVAPLFQDLRSQVQAIADRKKTNKSRPPIGEVSFRYEFDEEGEVKVVHASFISQRGVRTRFMRLRRAEKKTENSQLR